MKKTAITVAGILALGVAAYGLISWRNASNWRAVTTTVFRLALIEESLWDYGRTHGEFPSCGDALCLGKALPPACGQQPVLKDGWGRPFVTTVSRAAYLVYSGGADGKRDEKWRGAIRRNGEPWDPDNDIVLKDGQMPQYPWGILAGWSSPPWGVVIPSEGHPGGAQGVLQVCVAFSAYPAPFVRILSGGSPVARDQKPGRFSFFLPPGSYRVEVSRTGEEPTIQQVDVRPGRVTTLEI